MPAGLLDDEHQAILTSHHPEILGSAGEEFGNYLWRDNHTSPTRIGPLKIPGASRLGKRSLGAGQVASRTQICLKMGGQTTLMVWADLDHDMSNGDQLKAKFWESAQTEGINQEFEKVVFVFAKDRTQKPTYRPLVSKAPK